MAVHIEQDFTKPGVNKGDPGKSRLGVWSRLEPRPRAKDYSRALALPSADALFMINRQLFLGEFKAEDTGSPITADIEVKNRPVTHYGEMHGVSYELEKDIPLEAIVEAEAIRWNLRTNTIITTAFKSHLKREGLSQEVYEIFKTAFSSEILDASDDFTLAQKEEFSKIELYTPALLNAQTLISYIQVIGNQGSLTNNLNISGQQEQILINNETSLRAALVNFKSWYEELFYQHDKDFWQRSRLEYQFELRTTDSEGNQTKLIAEDYESGQPDWDNFRLDLDGGSIDNYTSIEESIQFNSYYIADVEFPGIPRRRLWEFEKARWNFGKMNLLTTDLPTISFAQFVMLYSNDWFLIPHKVNVGSTCTVQRLVVTDCFGFKTRLTPAINKTSSGSWSMYNLDEVNGSTSYRDESIFMPPSTFRTEEEKPIEKIIFIRDEMANLVWAIEKRIPSLLDGAVDGDKAYCNLIRQLKENNPSFN